MLDLDMRRSFKYKAKLSRACEQRADEQLRLLRELYNAALEERRDHSARGERVNFVSQCRELTAIRAADPEYAALDREATEWALRQLDRAFEAFFRRVQAGERAGYPRFKSARRFNSTTYRRYGWSLDGRHLTLRGIGRVKLHLSRPVEGAVKTVTLKRDSGGDWWVTFFCDDVPARPLPDTGAAVGIDLGLSSFLATSEGETVENPRHLRETEAALRRAQRRVARRKRGGQRRRKAVRVVAGLHRRVADARRDFHFKTARRLVERYDLIAVEDLNVRGLARTRMAKSIHDAGCGGFLHALATKAEEAGRELVAVNPAGTSQVCSGCGSLPDRPKTLAVRTHRCDCGLVLDRDVNAARNILARAGPSASGQRSQAAA